MDTGKLQGKSDQKHGIALDSLIYEYDAAFGDPLEHLGGDHLGSWKLEYPEYDIIEYVSCGSKGKHDRKNIIKEYLPIKHMPYGCATNSLGKKNL